MPLEEKISIFSTLTEAKMGLNFEVFSTLTEAKMGLNFEVFSTLTEAKKRVGCWI
jgi:hypothetical protein